MTLSFAGKSFCFTGKLADLKRSAAERETRARGGLTTETVNERLDVLVVGSVPSVGWKHGTYGNKIEKARSLFRARGNPTLVPEPAFIMALGEVAPSNAGAIDAKVVVCQYKFLSKSIADFDVSGVQDVLEVFGSRAGTYVSARADTVAIQKDLYGQVYESADPTALVIEIRICRQESLDVSGATVADEVTRAFEPLRGVDGQLRWFERHEGTADYIRLLSEIPSSKRIEGL